MNTRSAEDIKGSCHIFCKMGEGRSAGTYCGAQEALNEFMELGRLNPEFRTSEDYPEHQFRVELVDADIVALRTVFKDSAIEKIIEDNNLTELAAALSVLAKWDWLAAHSPDCRMNCALVEDNGKLRFDGDVTSAQVKNGKVQLNVN